MLLVMLGGALGSGLRHFVGVWVGEQQWAQGFPYGTLFINASGSFILGVLALVIREQLAPIHQDWYLLLGTGFCGGFTTFSTFEWETYKLLRDGSWVYALANVVGSVVAGFVGILLAALVVSLLFHKR